MALGGLNVAVGLPVKPSGPAPVQPDPTAPWMAPWVSAYHLVQQHCHAGHSLPAALNAALTGGTAADPRWPRFVPQAELPAGAAYEQHIFATGCVPTRENPHDLFNGLCRSIFPATKRRLNQLQATEIERRGVGQVRGPVRDALTLFDENAVLLQAPEPLWHALLARDWPLLFVDLRALWRDARVLVFGHALQEKLLMPYKAITGHVFTVPVPASLGADWSAWDAWSASQLSAEALGQKPFTPLPVLGVPGWCAENAAPAYYADASVFRPKWERPHTRRTTFAAP